MKRVLVLFAHPALERSRIHRRLIAQAPTGPALTVHDLYEAYPDFDIDVRREQELLLAHDVVVFQHPFFWYSTPPLVKQWEDLVLEHGWAYGTGGTRLRGKTALSLVTAGGRATAYARGGHNRFTVRELLAPVEQTVRLCGMHYLPPYVVFGAHWLDDDSIAREAIKYRVLLNRLVGDQLAVDDTGRLETLNAALADLDPQRAGT